MPLILGSNVNNPPGIPGDEFSGIGIDGMEIDFDVVTVKLQSSDGTTNILGSR